MKKNIQHLICDNKGLFIFEVRHTVPPIKMVMFPKKNTFSWFLEGNNALSKKKLLNEKIFKILLTIKNAIFTLSIRQPFPLKNDRATLKENKKKRFFAILSKNFVFLKKKNGKKVFSTSFAMRKLKFIFVEMFCSVLQNFFFLRKN